jgi:hypothetical protein
MARASYIYIVRSYTFVHATFTVKHEMVAYLRKAQPEHAWVERHCDGRQGEIKRIEIKELLDDRRQE